MAAGEMLLELAENWVSMEEERRRTCEAVANHWQQMESVRKSEVLSKAEAVFPHLARRTSMKIQRKVDKLCGQLLNETLDVLARIERLSQRVQSDRDACLMEASSLYLIHATAALIGLRRAVKEEDRAMLIDSVRWPPAAAVTRILANIRAASLKESK